MMLTHWTSPRSSPALREDVTGGAVHMTFTQKGNRAEAAKAFERLKAACLKIKPDPKNGGVAAVRELRDA